MSVQRTQQAQERLGTSDVVMLTERVEDVALLIGPLVTRGLLEVLDRPSPRPWPPRGLRGGVGRGELAGRSRPRRRSPERSGGNLSQGPASPPEPPDRAGHRAAGCAGCSAEPSPDTHAPAALGAPDGTRLACPAS